MHATYDYMQHYSSVIGLLNQTGNGCGGVRILKKENCSKKEQKKNIEKRNLSSVQAWRKWKIRRGPQGKSPHPGKSPAYDIKNLELKN